MKHSLRTTNYSIMIFVEKMFLGWLHNMNHFQTYKLTSSCLMVLYTMYGVAVIVWQLELQLHIQAVPITTDVVSLNLDQGEVYNIM